MDNDQTTLLSSTYSRVIGITRHHARVLTETGDAIEMRVSPKAKDIIVGDQVTWAIEGQEYFVTKILGRANCLQRSYRDKEKKIAANLDMLLIVTAVTPLFNTTFVDRVLTVAWEQSIPCTLVVNKTDLGVDQTLELIAIYEKLAVPVVLISAKFKPEIVELRSALQNDELNAVALCGVSGVGKSTILNRLIPEAERTTSEVSERTGQGRQTTTYALGYPYLANAGHSVVIIDLPGLQKFGVTHLTKELVAESMPEIASHTANCQFSNCSHIGETKCAVKEGVESGLIASSRYQSYIDMIKEIEDAREY
jgi:ribosome biogenesis GTPase